MNRKHRPEHSAESSHTQCGCGDSSAAASVTNSETAAESQPPEFASAVGVRRSKAAVPLSRYIRDCDSGGTGPTSKDDVRSRLVYSSHLQPGGDNQSLVDCAAESETQVTLLIMYFNAQRRAKQALE